MKSSSVIILLGIVVAVFIFLYRKRPPKRESSQAMRRTPSYTGSEPIRSSIRPSGQTAGERKLSIHSNLTIKRTDANTIYTHIAGIPHKLGKDVQIQSILQIGQPLRAIREKNNAFDSNAISLHTNSLNLGFIPKIDNPNIAIHMDAGKQVNVSIMKINAQDLWQGVRIKIELL